MEIAFVQLPRMVEWVKYCEFAGDRDLDQEVGRRMYPSCSPALNTPRMYTDDALGHRNTASSVNYTDQIGVLDIVIRPPITTISVCCINHGS